MTAVIHSNLGIARPFVSVLLGTIDHDKKKAPERRCSASARGPRRVKGTPLMTSVPHGTDNTPPPPSEDDEKFCLDCFAGLESSEHHAECIAPLDQLEEG